MSVRWNGKEYSSLTAARVAILTEIRSRLQTLEREICSSSGVLYEIILHDPQIEIFNMRGGSNLAREEMEKD